MTAPTENIWRTAPTSSPTHERVESEIAAAEAKIAAERAALAAKLAAANSTLGEWQNLLAAGRLAAQRLESARSQTEILEIHRADTERKIHALVGEYECSREWFVAERHSDVLADNLSLFLRTEGEMPFVFHGRKLAACDAALVVVRSKLPALEAAEVAARREAEAFAKKHGIAHDFGLK